MEHPKWFVVTGEKEKVYLLKKVLYGLKQAIKVDEHLLKHDFKKSLSESTLYIRNSNSNYIMGSLYVDDLLL